jgi:1-deoxy-D-xylulose-5-phosphate reductoisomerase
VHPQSVVHSMVEFDDGSTLAQCSPPDMRLPIALGLGWPDRVPGAAPGCDWSTAATWEFAPLDEEAFPAIRIARECGEAGGTFPAVYNAANEECVAGFLGGRIGFLDIVDTIARVVDDHVGWEGARSRTARRGENGSTDAHALTLEDVLAAEEWARRQASAVLGNVGEGRR